MRLTRTTREDKPLSYRMAGFFLPFLFTATAAGTVANRTHPGATDTWMQRYRQAVPAPESVRLGGFRPATRTHTRTYRAPRLSGGGGGGGWVAQQRAKVRAAARR